jgi:hypothetical protein
MQYQYNLVKCFDVNSNPISSNATSSTYSGCAYIAPLLDAANCGALRNLDRSDCWQAPLLSVEAMCGPSCINPYKIPRSCASRKID